MKISGSLQKIAKLFGVGIPAVSKHLDNIYEEGELDKNSTISILETVQKEGNREVKRNVEHYNLAIILVGYKAPSASATQFSYLDDRTVQRLYSITTFLPKAF